MRAAVNGLSRAIEEISAEYRSIAESDPQSHIGPLLKDRIGELRDRRLRLLFDVVFGEVEVLGSGDAPVDPLTEGNIVVDGVALAHETLF